MNFDEISDQHVSRRRRQSPIRNKRSSPYSIDTEFPQKVSPRSGRSQAGLNLSDMLLFGKKKTSRSASGSRYKKRRARGVSSFLSILKKAPVAMLALFGVFIVLNWSDIVSERQAVTPKSLEDPNTPPILIAAFDPIGSNSASSAVLTNTPAAVPAAELTTEQLIIQPPAPVETFPAIPSAFPAEEAPANTVNSLVSPAPAIPASLTVTVSANTAAAGGSPTQAVQYVELPLNLTETFSWTERTVRQGDTVSGIAEESPVSQQSIIAYNNLKEAWNLPVGMTLKIPNIDGIPYTVVKNDSLSKIAKKMDVPQNAILDANDLQSETIRPGQVLFIPGAKMNAEAFRRSVTRVDPRTADRPMIFPIPGRITSGYGWRLDPMRPNEGVSRFHRALDLSGNTGDPVKAVMDGKVVYMGSDWVFGNVIVLDHGVYKTRYAHLSAYSVKMGETVTQGQKIGEVGNSGRSTGPHLHLEVFKGGKHINPLEVLK